MARGLTQAQLSSLSGIERTYLARLEAGHSVQLLDRALAVLRDLGVEVIAVQEPDDGET